MNTILQLRENRAKKWDAAKAFLDVKRGTDGLLSAEDAGAYEKMEAEVVALGKEVERLERQVALDAELNKPTADPLTSKPAQPAAEQKTGRASDAYKKAFWNAIPPRTLDPRFSTLWSRAPTARVVISYQTSSKKHWCRS